MILTSEDGDALIADRALDRHHANVCESSNPLPYFLCAVHRQAAPQPHKKKDRHAFVSSNRSSESASSCAFDGKNCELPQLSTTSMLPLGNWDGLYYALVAEIRRIHSDLQEKFGWAIGNGVQPLHHYGTNGKKREAVTPIELASMLETAWYRLMDNRLVASLDDAVRMRKIRDNVAEKRSSTSTKASSHNDNDGGDNEEEDTEDDYERPPVDQGLVDVNGMNTEDIIDMLWARYAAEVDQACTEYFEDESMFTAHQADVHAQIIEQTRALDDDPPLSGRCRCRGKCICFLGESTDGAEPDLRKLSLERTHDRQVPSRYRNRQRTNTENSELACVPDSTSTRSKGKDAYPLAFYTDGSPGRYPKIRKDSAVDDGPSSNAGRNNLRTFMRKPVPAPLKPVSPYVAPDAGYGVTTPPSDSKIFAAKAQAADAESKRTHESMVEMVQSKNTVTHSFPINLRDPRQAVNSDPFMDSESTDDPAYGYVDLLPRHPSSFEEADGEVEPFPSLARSATITPPRVPKPREVSAGTNHLPTLKSLANNTVKPTPPLPPLPDFIAPRPATVQRYVSAGGTLPLAQRTAIQGPAFHSIRFNTPVNHASGAGISKAELDDKMSDPEWVAKHFGNAAAERVSLSPPKKLRASEESSVAVMESQHSSREASARTSVDQQTGYPRTRTSSGVARLKRVFSRKNSESEWD